MRGGAKEEIVQKIVRRWARESLCCTVGRGKNEYVRKSGSGEEGSLVVKFCGLRGEFPVS